MQLRYYVPFKAQEGVSAELILKEKLINIEGVAIDTSVNANKWQIPEEDLDFFVQSLIGAQLRVDHAESALMVVGKVPEAKRMGSSVWFRAEVGDEKLIEKIIRNYVNTVSAQVDSENVECSKCKKPTRKEGMLVHLCPGAWEIVHKPKVRELSIVASPAYKTTEFHPVGFAVGMNDSQYDAILKNIQNSRLLQIHFHTLRHFKATMEYHRTRNILYVKQLLGHKRLENTEIYTHLIDFENDEYHSATAKTIEEAKQLIESGFEYVTDMEGIKLFRKRK